MCRCWSDWVRHTGHPEGAYRDCRFRSRRAGDGATGSRHRARRGASRRGWRSARPSGAAAQSECRARDGTRITRSTPTWGTSGMPRRPSATAPRAVAWLRTEFLFLERETAPSEAEQLRGYQAHRHCASAVVRSCCASWISAVTSRCAICHCRTKRIPRWAQGHPHGAVAQDLRVPELRAALRVEPFGIVGIPLPHDRRWPKCAWCAVPSMSCGGTGRPGAG
jgi:hypothetical protein